MVLWGSRSIAGRESRPGAGQLARVVRRLRQVRLQPGLGRGIRIDAGVVAEFFVDQRRRGRVRVGVVDEVGIAGGHLGPQPGEGGIDVSAPMWQFLKF